MTAEEWVWRCAQRLRQRWPSPSIADLEEVAARLWQEPRWRELEPRRRRCAGCGSARWCIERAVLVDVIELRRRGLRRPAEELRAAVPVRGVLSMKPSRGVWAAGQRHPPLLAMLLAPELPEHLLEPLDQARVTRIRQGALLIVGLQEVVRPIRHVEHCRQAWWVRPVGAQP